MNIRTFWLASNSPQRREILSWSDWNIRTISSNVDESLEEGESPREYVLRMAERKCAEGLMLTDRDDFVIAADTTVVLDEKILGKPDHAQQARAMLAALRGREHRVMTGLAIGGLGISRPRQDICVSIVRMRELTDREIQAYVDTGDPLDKAGAYAIQNPYFDPTVSFDGCYASVMGMPLCHLERTLRSFPDYHHTNWSEICQMKLKYDCPITARVMSGEDIG